MTDLVFPLTVVLLVYVVAVPLLTLVADRLLSWTRRDLDHAAEFGSLGIWAFLMGPVMLPLIWVLSGAFHQFDGHHAVAACIQAHSETECAEAIILAMLLLIPLMFSAARRRGTAAMAADSMVSGIPLARGRGVSGLVCTRGILRPVIELDEALEDSLTPTQLSAVLEHEVAHAKSRDPLFFWLLRVALAVNPAGALLARHAAAWEFAREVRCDLRAIRNGANRFELAEALVRVASEATRSGTPLQPHRCGFVGAVDKLELRVRILCADELPSMSSDRSLAPLVLFVAALLASHEVEHGLIDWLHHNSERLFLSHLL